jgi:hypothetical protein
MSWLFSAALMKECESLRSLQEPVAEYLGESSWDGEPSAPLSVMPTPHKFWRNDKTMEFSDLSRFGLTCAVLTESRGEELLTLYLAAFHAKTFPAQEKAQDLTESAADCGQSLPGLLARYDPATHSLRTAQCSLFGDLTECYVTLPRWGLMRDGALYLPPTVALPMREKDCGLWPTPTAQNAKHAEATEWEKKNRPKHLHVLAAVKKWPTPTAHNAKETNAPSESERNTPTLAAQAGGALNPMWVEWLMGWPIGWTDLKPLATDKFQSAWLKHFDYLANSDQPTLSHDRPQD